MINTGNNIITYSHATVKVDAFISVVEWPRILALIPKSQKRSFNINHFSNIRENK